MMDIKLFQAFVLIHNVTMNIFGFWTFFLGYISGLGITMSNYQIFLMSLKCTNKLIFLKELIKHNKQKYRQNIKREQSSYPDTGFLKN